MCPEHMEVGLGAGEPGAEDGAIRIRDCSRKLQSSWKSVGQGREPCWLLHTLGQYPHCSRQPKQGVREHQPPVCFLPLWAALHLRCRNWIRKKITPNPQHIYCRLTA